jgi:hypothetical protein
MVEQAEQHAAMMLELEAAELEQEALFEAEMGVRIADPDDEAAAPGDAQDVEGEAPSADLALEDLRDRGDAETLLSRAKALRTGDGVERDLEACLEHYRAAGEIGSPHGKFSEALFYLSGAVVAEDVSAGMGKLRSAAQVGSLRAKIYLANAYELGVGRDPDPEKADVWYRSAVRAAGIEHDPDEDEAAFTLALANIGSIRHARALLRDESIPKKDRFAYLKNAKALGYALHQRNKQRASMEQEAIAREIEQAMASAPAATDEEEEKEAAPKNKAANKPEVEPESGPQIGPSKPKMDERITAFVIALGMVGAGIALGVFGTAAGKQMLVDGKTIPIFGVHYGYMLPAAVGGSMLMVALVYEWSTILLASVAGLVLGGAGWTLWKNPAGALFHDRLTQAHVFGLVGVVVALLVIGLLGGTRRRRWSK